MMQHIDQHVDGTATVRVCEEHAFDWVVDMMIDTRPLPCSNTNCPETARFGFWGRPLDSDGKIIHRFPHETNKPLWCGRHAPEGVYDILKERCAAPCPRLSTMGKEGSGNAVFCSLHAEDGMVEMCARRGCKATASIRDVVRMNCCSVEHTPDFER